MILRNKHSEFFLIDKQKNLKGFVSLKKTVKQKGLVIEGKYLAEILIAKQFWEENLKISFQRITIKV